MRTPASLSPTLTPMRPWLCVCSRQVGTYLAEYSITYKPIKHGRPGIGATASSKFVPLK